MEKLIIKATTTTPEINFDADSGVLNISGESYPENALDFYRPVFRWIKEFFNDYRQQTTVNFKLIYFNTSSSKAILDMLDLFEKKHKKEKNIEVNWFYHVDDEDILENGEEFAEGLTLPYNLVSFS